MFSLVKGNCCVLCCTHVLECKAKYCVFLAVPANPGGGDNGRKEKGIPDVSAVSSHRSGRRLELLFFSGRAEVRAQSGMERGDRIASFLQILAQSSFSQPSDSQGRLGGRGSGEGAIGLSEADLRHSRRASSLRKLNNCAPPALFPETA